MVDISNKLEKIVKLIDYGMYFTINRSRQYGKTTIMSRLFATLQDRYIVIAGSLEDFGEDRYANERIFSRTILEMIAEKMEKQDKQLAEFVFIEAEKCEDLKMMSNIITKICTKSTKEIVLMIDEVDKASSNIMFLDFLAALRKKYNERKVGDDKTFKSVILAGVHDVKNLKVHISERRLITEEEAKMIDKTTYNSPWNVAEDFLVDMSFNPEEISGMLREYEADYKTRMDVEEISREIYGYTSGYPFLVSKICKIIDERLLGEGSKWSIDGVQKAINIILNEKGTLFDDLIKNIQNDEKLHDSINEMVIEGKEKSYNVYAYEKGLMYGIFAQGENNKLKIHNKIFEKLIYEYMMAKKLEEKELLTYEYRTSFIDEKGDLKMEVILEKFQLLMKQEYREKDRKFIEKEGRLLFLCFVRPIINGTGFYFVEPQTRQDNRMDIVITFNKKQYIIELKIWHGQKRKEEGLVQTARYLDTQNEEIGYMVSFDFNKNKKYTKEWVDVDGKRIFEIMV